MFPVVEASNHRVLENFNIWTKNIQVRLLPSTTFTVLELKRNFTSLEITHMPKQCLSGQLVKYTKRIRTSTIRSVESQIKSTEKHDILGMIEWMNLPLFFTAMYFFYSENN